VNAARAGGLALAILLLSGCPVPLIKSAATVTMQQLPEKPDELIKYADEIYAKASGTEGGGSGAMENALMALDKAHALDPKSYEAAWKAARAAAWLADDLYDDKNKRAHFSGRGIEYAKAAIELNPKGVEGHYYSGINLGLQTTTKTIGAKFMVPSVRDAWKKAMQLDGNFDHGGPARSLGTLYAKAPPWPASIGDADKGVDLLQQAMKKAPDYPLNSLLLGDALVAAEKPEEAKVQYRTVLGSRPTPEDAHFLVKWKTMAKKALDDLEKKEKQASNPSS
jgi:tetratricopeptide (TPR) repeat protein